MVREAFLEVKNAHTRRGNKEVKKIRRRLKLKVQNMMENGVNERIGVGKENQEVKCEYEEKLSRRQRWRETKGTRERQ
jgi:hypothetical protein